MCSWGDTTMRYLLEVFEEDHAPLFPLTTSDYVGFACATVGLLIAAGGGVGGGGILVPIYILVMGFSPKHAIPLSNVTVFGGAVANTILNAGKRHPLADRPLVDWDLILVMEPLTIAGALIGSFLNKVLDEQFLIIMLVVLLSATSYESLSKAVKMFKAETKAMRAADQVSATKESELTQLAREEEQNTEEILPLVEHMEETDVEITNEADMMTVPLVDKELYRILEEEKTIAEGNVKLIVLMFVVVLAINILKGGGAFKSPLGIRCGALSFWIANFIMMAWIIVISFKARAYLVDRFHIKQRVGYHYVDGDIQWSPRATLVYPLLCCFAGFFAGMFGIGGGIVKGPLMLSMGVHPAVSSASSATMILFTSLTATTSYMVFGLLLMDYGVLCLVVGFLATLVGQMGLVVLMKRYKRNSLIAFSIGGVVLLSAFLMTIQSIVAFVEGKRHHSGGICGKDE